MPRPSNADPKVRLAALMSKVTADPDTGCWEWQGSRLLNGYGTMRVHYSRRYTHRLSYELHVGSIPDGLQIDHLCRNRGCCNPEHLEPVTNAVNGHRGEGPAGRNKRKTHCVHGHEFAPENTYLSRRGNRTCRTCNLDYQRRHRVPKPRVQPTHCPQGHEYTAENSRVNKRTGTRSCRECGRASWRRWYNEVGREQVIERKRRQREEMRRLSSSSTETAANP